MTHTRAIVLLLCLASGLAADAQGSCKAQGCKYIRGASCQCNSRCSTYNDCCADYDKYCNKPSPPGPPHPPPTPPAPTPPSGPSGGPEQHHLALTSTPDMVTCSFATAKTYTQPPVCSLGSSPGKYTTSYNGTTSTYTDGNWNGLLHTVLMDGLTPGASYYYNCGGPEEFKFKAPVPVGKMPVTLGLVADLGEATAHCGNPDILGCANTTLDALGKAAAAGEFEVLVHAGDLAYTSGTQGIWDSFLREMEPTAARVPYQVSAGNHEHYYNFSGYLHRFAMPGEDGKINHSDGVRSVDVNNLYHSTDYGGVHLVAFSSEHDYTPGSAQHNFLKADLAKAAANRAAVPWIVVYAHRPLYCSTNDYYDCKVNGPMKLAPAIEPLLAAYKVDLYIAGHLHNYERTFPVMNGTVTSTHYDNPAAPVHVVVGMAGCDEGLTNTWASPTPAWSAVRQATLGYSRMIAHDKNVLSFEYVLSSNGTVFDSFNITKK